MSLGLDRRWRKKLIAGLDIRPGLKVLDIATGTGDVALLAARAGGAVTALDPSPRML
jgi:demethylmenaquinone methyltransferase / 2-methoxy-6-polyprenyl-1,4-benzoquinol methylase